LWFHVPVDSATEKRKRADNVTPFNEEAPVRAKTRKDDESVEALSSPEEGSSLEEVTVIQTTQKPFRFFLPVSRWWQTKICHRFGLKIRRFIELDPSVKLLTSPDVLQQTRGDGNYFFRCISLYLVGSEEEHGFVRRCGGRGASKGI